MSTIFQRAGGKRRLIAKFADWLPVKPDCFVEPFCGGAAVLLSRPRQTGVQEVINDINNDIVTVFRCVRFHADELIRQLEFRPLALVDFKAVDAPRTDIQRAADWLIANWMSFGGQGKNVGFAWCATSPRGIHAKLLRIQELAKRLDSVIIDSRPYEQCLKTFDRPNSFFFVDPPYLLGDCEYAAWTEADFVTLRDRLDALKGTWVLTTSSHPVMREIFKGKEIRAVERRRGISNNKKTPARYSELIIRPKNQKP